MSEKHRLLDAAAVVGIGATEFSKESGRSEMRLAVEACEAAIADAGLHPSQIDGWVTYSAETNPEIEIAKNLGAGEMTFFSRIHHGGGAACGVIQQAVLAVNAGVADYVVCYRAFNERSGGRFGAGVQDRPAQATAESAHFAWYAPFGLLTPAQWVAMFARRYLYEYGATTEAFGAIAVADRKHAATNPKAHFYGRPITMQDHEDSRWIVDPLRLLDCCQESDGAQALVVTTPERARDLANPPVLIRASAQAAGDHQEMMTSYYRPSITGLPEMGLCARQLYNTTGLGATDFQTAIIYDHFTPLALPQFEEFGFCKRGEAKDFVANGNIELGGGLPINTNGGQLGEAYIHGMNGIAEGVRQVRGTSVNQVANVEHVLVTAGTMVPTSALILGKSN